MIYASTIQQLKNTNNGHETYKSRSDLNQPNMLYRSPTNSAWSICCPYSDLTHTHEETRWRLYLFFSLEMWRLYLFFIIAQTRCTTAELSLTQRVWSSRSLWSLFQSPGRWCRRYPHTWKLVPDHRMPVMVEIVMSAIVTWQSKTERTHDSKRYYHHSMIRVTTRIIERREYLNSPTKSTMLRENRDARSFYLCYQKISQDSIASQ